jgi:hypothetical protein
MIPKQFFRRIIPEMSNFDADQLEVIAHCKLDKIIQYLDDNKLSYDVIPYAEFGWVKIVIKEPVRIELRFNPVFP